MKKFVFVIVFFLMISESVIAQQAWKKNRGLNIALSSKGIPAFPKSITEYKSARQDNDYWGNDFNWDGSLRVFVDGGWEEIYEFPHTMNHCSSGVFMLKWRASSPDILVDSTFAYSTENITRSKKGSFGYMYGTNCDQPFFRFSSSNEDVGGLVDIYYELKFWKASP